MGITIDPEDPRLRGRRRLSPEDIEAIAIERREVEPPAAEGAPERTESEGLQEHPEAGITPPASPAPSPAAPRTKPAPPRPGPGAPLGKRRRGPGPEPA